MVFGAITMHFVEVLVANKDRVYGATYTRKVQDAEDPAARKALDTLCVS